MEKFCVYLAMLTRNCCCEN